jgi:DNA mismatch repair ATPase MutS
VTTHDRALTSVADALGPAGANVHFDERLEGDRLAFDYTMRPGVVQQRNALALMRAVGGSTCESGRRSSLRQFLLEAANLRRSPIATSSV